MNTLISDKIRNFLFSREPATPQRVAQAVPELAARGGPQRALLLMRLDPTLEPSGHEHWAARGTAISDQCRVSEAAGRYFGDRPGAPLNSTVRHVVNDTGLPEQQVRKLLATHYPVIGTNIYNRRR